MTHATFPPARQAPARPVAAFDVDGTLTWADSYLLFLRFIAGRWGFVLGLVRLVPVFLAYRLGLVDRARVKQATLTLFLAGMAHAHYLDRCRIFARLIYPLISRPDGLARLRAHLGVQDQVAFVSASLRDYLMVWAEDLGVAHVLATNVEVRDGRLTGQILGENCWGPGKLLAIRTAFPDTQLAAAYGDTRGDRDMLAAADQAGFRQFIEAPRDRLARLIGLYAGDWMEREAANRL